jgi:hypothetical protein
VTSIAIQFAFLAFLGMSAVPPDAALTPKNAKSLAKEVGLEKPHSNAIMYWTIR